jgi:hypothetical protein
MDGPSDQWTEGPKEGEGEGGEDALARASLRVRSGSAVFAHRDTIDVCKAGRQGGLATRSRHVLGDVSGVGADAHEQA